MGEALEPLNQNHVLHAFGFGDINTKDFDVFPLSVNGYCENYEQVLKDYRNKVMDIKLSGPTNYAPVIYRSIDITKHSEMYSILVLIVDGMPTDTSATVNAVRLCSDISLFIIIIGVGDGPWDNMHRFIKSIKKKNIRFMDYNRIKSFASANEDAALALHSLVNIPNHFYSCYK